MTTRLEKVVGVESHDSRLIRLRNVSKDDVDHANQHAVLPGVAGVLDDGHNIGSFLGHVEQVAARTVTELDRVDQTLGAHYVGYVRDCRSGSRTKVQHLAIW